MRKRMAAKSFRLVMLALAVVMAVACGDAEEMTGGGSSTSTPDTVVVEGSVFTNFNVDLGCEEYSSGIGSLPEELSGVALTFSNAAGDVVGETSTGRLEWSELDYGCRFHAGYRVSLPAGPGYRVDFDPPSPEDSGFYGAEELTTQEISFDDLENGGFLWDFEAPPTFEVGDPPCAFDDTGCLAADLVIIVAADDGGLTLSLTATAGIEENGWIQEGTAADGGLEAATASLGDPADFPTVAPRFQLSVSRDNDGVEVLIRDAGEPSESGIVRQLELASGQSEEMTLPGGAYILAVTMPGSSSEEIYFGIRVP
jgi:hypothetical protein